MRFVALLVAGGAERGAGWCMTIAMQWTSRVARADDIDALIALRETAGWGARDVAAWLDDAARGNREIWVAESGAVIGMVALKFIDVDVEVANRADRAEVSSLAVSPSARGQGLGRALTLLAERRAVELGFRILTLNTAPDNAAALRLYDSMGYRESKRAQRDWGFAVHLEKRL